MDPLNIEIERIWARFREMGTIKSPAWRRSASIFPQGALVSRFLSIACQAMGWIYKAEINAYHDKVYMLRCHPMLAQWSLSMNNTLRL